ncbi:ABC transporter substrate-binding protein [Kribbella sp. CA-294648]|uniref:ABC transporter substrate-binding protein n=1 Tax=Kribbella sp. CA-294648 TaxID=3239948 RepID=UPI003D8A286A
MDMLPPSTELSRRSVLTMIGAVLASGAIAGCGRSDSPSDTGSGPLRMLALGLTPGLVQLYEKKLLPAFATETAVKVELQTSDWGSAFQKVLTAAASKTMPDVLMLGGIWTAPLVAANALLPLDRFMNSWKDKDQYYPSMLEDGRYDGKTYAVPLFPDVRTVCYRADMFLAAGLNPEKPPTTWDEYKEYAAKLVRRRGGDIITQGADWSLNTGVGLQQAFAQLMLQAGGKYYDDAGKATFASDPGLRALEYMVSFYRDGISSAKIVTQPTGGWPLVSGKAAMAFTNEAIYQNAKNSDESVVAKLKAGLPLKADAAAKPITTAWINKLGIAANTGNPDGAWKLIEFLSKSDNLGAFVTALGTQPPRKDLADAAHLRQIDKHFVAASEYIVPQPQNRKMLQIANLIATELQRAITLQDPPAQVLETIDKKIDGLTGA